MPAPSQTPRRILFVDDDGSFLEVMKELLATFSEGKWEIKVARSASEAFAVLQDQPVDLVVIDVQMPVMDGIQMLSLLNRGHPDLPKVVLTGMANEKYRTACLSNGAELFLEKPKAHEEWQSLYATLEQLLKWGKPQGFRGVMRRVELPEIIQMECAEGKSSILEIHSEGVTGRIFICEGAIVHADSGGKTGRTAFDALLAMRGGDFKVLPFAEPPARSLFQPWEELLMQASPAMAPAVVAKPAKPIFAAIGREAKVRPAPGPPVAEANRPTVEAILICSERGDVLYEWRCRELDVWVKFLEFVSQKSRRLAQGVALGEFDRLEIVREDWRIAVIIAPDRGVMIRTRRERNGSAEAAAATPRGSGGTPISEESKEQLGGWLRNAPSAKGVLVRGVRFPDQSMVCDLDSRDFPVAALEQSVRSVADTFQVLAAHGVNPFWLTWIYSRAALHCARRDDGAILAAVTLSKAGDIDSAGVERLLADFRKLTISAD